MAGPSQRDSSWSLRERDEAPSAMDNDNRAWIEKRTDSVQFFCFQGWPQKAEGRRQVRNLAARSRSVVTKTSFLPFPLQTWKVVSPSFLPSFLPSFQTAQVPFSATARLSLSCLEPPNDQKEQNSEQHQLYEAASPREYSVHCSTNPQE